ncbi:MAG: hypothetical protein U0163_03075 [Gemmatimonadaceae bacterium]
MNVIDVPGSSQLAAYSAAVAANNRLSLRGVAGTNAVTPRTGIPARAVPERPGEPSAIQHVVFIVRENRTYDQVLGDDPRGAGDSSLTMYGREVTPNTHALAEQFVLLDHFFASGGNSADGHQWLTQANETEYPMWPLYTGRSYPSEGNDPLAYSAGGFLWETAQAKGQRRPPSRATPRAVGLTATRAGALDGRVSPSAQTAAELFSRTVEIDVPHAIGDSVAGSRFGAGVSWVDARDPGCGEGRGGTGPHWGVGADQDDAEPRDDHPAERSYGGDDARVVHAACLCGGQ